MSETSMMIAISVKTPNHINRAIAQLLFTKALVNAAGIGDANVVVVPETQGSIE